MKPILYFGYNRNGTKWLGNLIHENLPVATPAHVLHYGIHETRILAHKKYWGDWKNKSEYLEFLKSFRKTDLSKLCNLDWDYFQSHYHQNYYDFFLEMMDQYAKRENKNYWITKIDPRFLAEIDEWEDFFKAVKKRYKNYYLLSIQRNYKDYITSSLNHGTVNYEKNQGSLRRLITLFSATIRYYNLYNKIDALSEKLPIKKIDFEQLKINRLKLLNEIASYVKMDYEIPTLKKSAYIKNTSFQNKEKSNKSDNFLMELVNQTFKSNSWLTQLMLKPLVWRRAIEKPMVPYWTKLDDYERDPQAFIKNLRKTNNGNLADFLDKE